MNASLLVITEEQDGLETAKVDVAISFLARDEGVARALHDLIADGLKVFFFPGRQEELAGTNGLESMREPFLTARVVVVFFRTPWGETPWTRVEQAAVTDRFLSDGWEWLLFVQLDSSSLPKWLPTTHVRFALEEYGIEQLAGAVKARVQQFGGKISRQTALGRARQVQAEANRRAEQESSFRDPRWIGGYLHPQLDALMISIRDHTVEIARELGMELIAGAQGRRCILRDNRVSLNIAWRQTYLNVVADRTNSGLLLCQYNGPVFFPSENMMVAFQPKEIRRRLFLPHLSMSRDVVWREDGKASSLMSFEDLVDVAVKDFIDLVDRVNRGRVALNYM